MVFPNKQNTAELQRIIKETTGQDVSIRETFRVWHYLNKVLLCTSLWNDDVEPPRARAQQALFD